jgi:predicted regulator of Ras-like GTPase activity (Roadblock/LC7/MglB family)
MAIGDYRGSMLDRRLALLSREGGFPAAYILNSDGLVMGGISPKYDQMMMSAMASLVIDVIKRSESLLQFKHTDEISLVDDDKNRLVCRPFDVGKKNPSVLILTLITLINQPYRMLTNRAIRDLKTMWEEMYG